ncbi:MAG: hypothetical protein K2W95_03915 [Candidatus Obscuribacterales bacterium]|nr:hypothetical protein [Candidatus Obscuribacterales bacterium]
MYDFTFVTYSELPNLDPDDVLVRNELEKRGMRVRAAIWNDAGVDWSVSGICVVRSTWDYHVQPELFVQWMCRVNALTNLLNPLDLMVWNCRKTYLRDLRDKGVSIVPTEFVDKGESPESLVAILERRGWSEAIVKPMIGLATFGVRKVSLHSSEAEDQEHFENLLRKGTVLVQEYMPAVKTSGEKAFAFVNGQFSHCVRKSAFQKLAVAGKAGEEPAVAAEDELSTARKILATLNTVPAYARVDLVRDPQGAPVLMELELIEPSLFVAMDSKAPAFFAEALCDIRTKLIAPAATLQAVTV